ncbi:MAG: Aspartyl/glutamyl-tRNA(Asn/Gln) amidotransferase subunit C [Candidatus Roizmanbacteria bacterium GW2011_GWA2_35_8]|uniref:Aspartyl/glutamyl-tRNA(Asn/Gln) amidotransferase subunit C n=1 Tax=Candidatus Roizmanbacteria bacterium GW2011_GWA2_35_8 TaxID=1618479 RepID=A0A0G0CZP5_9BACT|nr:MAG: Aspartyl/glutamyl-tRNA(Asn/Gln) amidotransferase subunit C [Candidatus Roizmanbacteria bacterium GW2011_GWA2_35_8]
MTTISTSTVKHISKLAKIPITEKEENELAKGFNKALEVIDSLFKVNIVGIEPTHQVTGLENILREDKVDEKKIFTQEQALSNTKKKHNGYFVVDQILAED